MAIYHLSMKPMSRSSGRSSVAAAAYRAAEKLTNQRDGLTHDFSRRFDQPPSIRSWPEASSASRRAWSDETVPCRRYSFTKARRSPFQM